MSPAREVTGTGPEPVTLDVALDAGRVRVNLAPPAEDGASLRVRLEADPDAPPGWLRGLGRCSGFLGVDRDGPSSPEERAEAAVAGATLEWDAETRRVTVRGPRDLGLRGVPLAVTVRAPQDSALRVRAGAARVAVEGRAGEVSVHGTGEVRLDEVAGRTDLRCGAGEVRIGRLGAPLRLTGGAGEIRVDHVHAPVEITTGAGRVRLGDVARRRGDPRRGRRHRGGRRGRRRRRDRHRRGLAVGGRARRRRREGRAERRRGPRAQRAPGARRPTPTSPTAGPLRVRARTGAGDVTVATARPRPALTTS